MITGHLTREPLGLVLERHLPAPVMTVWEYLTVSPRLAHWFGTWQGDPASGRVEVTWAVEEGAPSAAYGIEACEPPHHLRVVTLDGPDAQWTIDITLADEGQGTHLVFTQPLADTAMVADLGPGWEYYLDRLQQAVETGRPATVEWGDAHTSLSAEYAALLS